MNEYVYLKPREAAAAALPDLPVPVRSGRLGAVMHAGRLEPGALLDELDDFLGKYPAYRSRYAELAARLSYLSAMQMAGMGLWEAAARSLETGLRWNPHNWSVRVNHAVALHLTGDFRRALEEYRKAIADPEVAASPLVTILAARCCRELGDWQLGARLLTSLVPLAPREPAFWEFLSALEKRAASAAPRPAANNDPPHEDGVRDRNPLSVHAMGQFCTQCGTQSRNGDRFCRQCGSLLHSLETWSTVQ
jgi:tetratricopeptide (TPR) repeat protein